MKEQFIAEWVPAHEFVPSTSDEVFVKDSENADRLGIGTYRGGGSWGVNGVDYWKPTHWLRLRLIESPKEQAIELMRKILSNMMCHRGSECLVNYYNHEEVVYNAKEVIKALRPEFNDVLPEIGLLDFWTEEQLNHGK